MRMRRAARGGREQSPCSVRKKREFSVQPMRHLRRLLRAQGRGQPLRAAVARTSRGRARARLVKAPREMWYMLPYNTSVLDDAPTAPDMILMPGGLGAGPRIEGDPVGTASDVDTDAAEELFKNTYPKLAGWVRRLVGDEDTAHEIAAEAFVRLLSRWTRVESPQSYLYMIATNLIRAHWRKAERERRAIRSVTAAAALDDAAYPDQDVDVRNLLA